MSKLYKRPGSSYYWWTAYYNGIRLRVSTKMTSKTYAKKVSEHFDFCMFNDDLSFVSKKKAGTDIQIYINEYLKFLEKRKTKHTLDIAKGVFKFFEVFLRELGIENLSDIKTHHLNQYIDNLDRAPKTKKNHIGVLSLMFKQAIIDGLLTKNPTKHVSLPKMKKSNKHRELYEEDLEIIFKDVGKWRLYYLFLFYTGLRASDVAMLRYGDIDNEKSIITTLVRKSNRIHQIPLADTLLKELSYWGEDDEPIFPNLYAETYRKRNDLQANPRKYLQKILKNNNREKATLHSFRVTFNCILRNNGLKIEDRQKLLAHSSSETTKIYTHPNLELAREHVNKIPCYFNGV